MGNPERRQHVRERNIRLNEFVDKKWRYNGAFFQPDPIGFVGGFPSNLILGSTSPHICGESCLHAWLNLKWIETQNDI